ncbi:MAG: YncE family protein [Chitinophagales bacterium]|nr:YncE family protein [Bacteroidota bacterium]MCB9042774.1 YncE family protein [Chitinophagales bacterium]
MKKSTFPIHAFVFLCVFLVLFQFSCKKEDNKGNSEPTTASVLVCNEGIFLAGNSSISIYNPNTQEVNNNVFENANERPLGDVCQSAALHEGYWYLVINNSGKIEVIDTATYSSVQTIVGFNSPRNVLFIDETYAYVSDLFANRITVIDYINGTTYHEIPTNGWVENMLLHEGNVWAANAGGNNLYIINPQTNLITDSIVTAFSPVNLQIDANGKLWVLCSGDWDGDPAPHLQRFSMETRTLEADFDLGSGFPDDLVMNKEKNHLYWLNGDVYALNIEATALPDTPLISAVGKNLYGLGIQPSTNDIYVADAVDFQQNGSVYIYDKQGVFQSSFGVGINPGKIYFRE